MTSIATYTRKRKKGTGFIGVGAVDSKPDFTELEFSHVGLGGGVKKLEGYSRRGKKSKKGKKEEGGEEGGEGGEEGGGEAVEDKGVEKVTRTYRRKDAVGRKPVARRAFAAAVKGGCEALLKVVDDTVAGLAPLKFEPPVAFVYNPLEYARKPYEEYVRKYGGKKVEVLIVSTSPGPFGMTQTGVPFGDSVFVREFLHITSEIKIPGKTHPKRPIIGLNCPRREVSGQRLWGWAKARFGTASAFFERFWVYSYCPLLFVESSGKSRTPDKLTPTEGVSITNVCNEALRAVIGVTKPRVILGIGEYAGDRIKECAPSEARVGHIIQPSPSNLKATKNWDKLIEGQLRALGVNV